MTNFESTNLNAMKRNILILIVTTTLISCKYDSKIYEKLTLIENILDEELNDSALNEINSIDINKIKEDRDFAYYNLLKTQTLHRCYLPVASDSAINLSIKYYKKISDNSKLAKAYYYKGAILCTMEDMQKAVVSLKQGEMHARKSENRIISHHIAEVLAFINMKTGNYNTALEYGYKALKQSQGKGNKAWMAEDLNRISAIYCELDNNDSSYLYLKKALKYVEHTQQDLKAELYANAGALYFNNGDLTSAKAYVEKSLSAKPTAASYYILGSIYIKQGKEKEAWSLWNKALSTDDLALKAEIMQWMADHKYKQGEYKEAAAWTDRIARTKDSLKMKQQSENILRLQNNMEKAETEKDNNEKQNLTIYILAFATATCLIIIIYHRMRIKKAQSIISEHQARIEKYSRRIEQITASGKLNEREINKLKQKINNLREKGTEILALGSRLHDGIESGGTAARWSKKDYEAFVEHCRIEHPELTESIEKEHKGLTAYNIFFLMLCNKGKDSTDIQRIMGIAPGAVRTLKYRLRGKGAETGKESGHAMPG